MEGRRIDLIDPSRISAAQAQTLLELYETTIGELERLNDPAVAGLILRLEHLRAHVQELEEAQMFHH